MRLLPHGLILLSGSLGVANAYTWPSPQYDALEGLLYEGRRPDGSSLASLVHPCRKRVTTMASVAAEWLRFAFHDMATFNAEDGTGGMDGSLVYELNRPENFGLGFNQTSNDFETFPNKLVSRADVIAIGAIHGVASCGGPIVPFRGGRVDTYTAGATGTPEPHHDIATLTEMFRKQGFSTADMIKLTACGHTMGGVRSADFPALVPPNTGSDIPVIQDFDTTMTFDNKIVTEYLDGTTNNVLVTAENRTMASDQRVFEADNNATVRGLTDNQVFQNECRDVFARMLDTVPRGVSLTDEIALLPEKVTYAQLTIEKEKLVFKTNLRLAQNASEKANSGRVVTMFWCDRYGSNKDCKGVTRSTLPVKRVSDSSSISPVIDKMGISFNNYNFVVPIDAAQSIAKFWFEVDEKDGSKVKVVNNGGEDYPVAQDSVIFLPMLSTVDVYSNGSYTKVYTNRNGEDFHRVYNLVAGVRSDLSPSRVYADGFDSSVKNYAYFVSGTADLTVDPAGRTQAGYKLYTGTFNSSGLQLMLDLSAEIGGNTVTEKYVQTLLLDNTPYVAPSTAGTGGKATAGAGRDAARGWAVMVACVGVGAALLGGL